MPYGRIRSRSLGSQTGVVSIGGDGWEISFPSTRSGFEQCHDVVGGWPHANNLHIHKSEPSGSLVSFNRVMPGYYHKAQLVPSGLNWGDAPPYSGEVPNNLVLSLLSRSGPLTPKVYLGTFAYELKDIPDMLKHAGDLLFKFRNPHRVSNPIKEAAAANLAYNFGWKPLIEDLIKLSKFAELVEKRRQQLAAAQSGKGLRRRVNLGTYSTDSTQNLTLWNDAYYLRPPVRLQQSLEIWGTARWKCNNLSGISGPPSFSDAWNSVLGLNLGHMPISIWKALPWSWMFDWCYNLSDVLQRNYNMLYYTPENVCIMRHFTSTASHPEWPEGDTPILTAGRVVNHWKMREVIPPHSYTEASLKLPFLDSFKLSILGSLTIVKLSRR